MCVKIWNICAPAFPMALQTTESRMTGPPLMNENKNWLNWTTDIDFGNQSITTILNSF
jgi:hypothetical protein